MLDKNIFELLFKANVRLDEIATIFGYDEEQVIQILSSPDLLTVEERDVIEKLTFEYSFFS